MRAFLLRLCVLLSALTVAPRSYGAPVRSHKAPAASVPVVMLSDIHFDPFHDPGKVAELRRQPVSAWAAILNGPPSASQNADFIKLQSACQARGADSSWQLVQSSLHEAKARQPKPLFVTVSGDLLAHSFPCRFRALAPNATAADLSSFSSKTIEFLAMQLRNSFPTAPVYLALGNNDSGCMDYRETPQSPFLQSVAESFADDLRNPANRASLLNIFPRYGDYSVVLPAPMRHTRLIVLQDVFASTHFAGCDGKPAADSSKAQLDWLRAQLTAARAAGEQVWVMTHIPPGIDVYTSFHRYLFAPGEACGVTQPTMFLKDGSIGDAIAEFSDIVRLAIFAHTHMDEIKLLPGAGDAAVPVKIVPSISPVNGNEPTFVVAQILPQTATLKDYTVYVAQNAQGSAWSREYRYSDVYGLADFSAASVRRLTDELVSDKTGEGETSRAYERYFLAGGGAFAAVGLQRLWPAYSCSLREMDPAKFHGCMCPARGTATPTTP